MRRAPDVLLLLNGELRQPKTVKALARRADAVLCADGGARHARALGLIPDHVVGDMDSLPRPLPRSWRRTSFLRDLDRDRGDLDKSLDLAVALGAGRVFVAGALGGGLDHELVNLSVLEARGGDFELIVVGGGGAARLLGPGRHALGLKKGERFSLLAAPRARVTLIGARYGLKRETLAKGSRGLGNRARGRPVLTIHAGRVWLVSASLGPLTSNTSSTILMSAGAERRMHERHGRLDAEAAGNPGPGAQLRRGSRLPAHRARALPLSRRELARHGPIPSRQAAREGAS